MNGAVVANTDAGTSTYYLSSITNLEAGEDTIDSSSSSSSGPLYFTAWEAGTYHFQMEGCGEHCISDCGLTNVATVYVGDTPTDDAPTDCPGSVGKPVNVATGNVWFAQTDYRLPGPGPAIELTRTYNSSSNRAGIFGRSWTTNYDDHISPQGPELVAYRRGDGGVSYHRIGTGAPETPSPPPGGTPVKYSLTLSDPGNPGGQAIGGITLAQHQGYTISAGVTDSLDRNSGGGYTVTRRNGEVRLFNSAGKLTSITDRNGNQTTLSWSTGTYGARLNTVTDPVGRVLTFNYSSLDRVTSIADATGTIATYTYDSDLFWNTLLGVTYADGSGYTFTSDFGAAVGGSNWRYLNVKDKLNNILEAHTYDSSGRGLTSSSHGGAESYTLSYVSATQTTVTDGLSTVRTYTHEAVGGSRRVTHVDGCGCSTSEELERTFDGAGNVLTMTNAMDETTTFTYDTQGNVLTQTDPTGATTTYTYNSHGQVLTVTDPLEAVTTYEYDANGNLESVTDPLENTWQFSYNGRGQLTGILDPASHSTTFGYDSVGNLNSTTDPLSHATTYTHDGRGRVLTSTNALSETTTFTYDSVGRLLTQLNPAGDVTTFTYDLAGRRTTVQDPNGKTTTYGYDGAYRLTSVTDAASRVTGYGYDAMSRLTSITDPRSKVTTFTRDSQGRVVTTTYPGSRVETTTYDAAGRRATFTDRNGVVTTFSYDEAGRLTEKSYSDSTPTTTFAYDEAGRLTEADNGDDSVGLTYDLAGGLLSETSTRNSSTVASTYGTRRQRTALSLDGTTVVTYSHDAALRLWQITRGSGALSFYTDAVNRRSAITRPNLVVSNYVNDLDGRLRLKQDDKVVSGVVVFAVNDNYYYNAGSEIYESLFGGIAKFNVYDQADRLTTVYAGMTLYEQYSYDAASNRTSSAATGTSSWSYSDRNELQSIGSGTTFSYDLNGNMTSKTVGSTVWGYEWDAENRLRRVTLGGDQVASFAYDALGRRVEKKVAASGGSTLTSAYTYDGQNILRERQLTTTIVGGEPVTSETERYLYMHGPWVDEPLVREDSTGARTYYHTDVRGSIVAETDNTGNSVTATREYDAFGKILSGSTAAGYAYTGREWDPETALYYYRARYYDPSLGRFMSEDPIGFDGGVNFYEYARSNPVSFSDPDGTTPAAVADGARWLGIELSKFNNTLPPGWWKLPIAAAVGACAVIGANALRTLAKCQKALNRCLETVSPSRVNCVACFDQCNAEGSWPQKTWSGGSCQ